MIETRNSFIKTIRPVLHLIVVAFLCYAALLIPLPVLPTLLLESLCPGENECSEVIFLAGALQLGIGIGALVMSPLLGGLSDAYGRKPILLSVFLTAIIQQVVLAYMKSKTTVYMWFFFALIAYTLREAGFVPTLLASVADVVDGNHRPLVNGLTMGSLSVGFVVGTIFSLILKSVDQALWASVIVQVCGTIYLTVFFKETNPRQPLLPEKESQPDGGMKLLPKPALKRHLLNNFRETAWMIWSSRRLMTIALVDFVNSYGLKGLESFTGFYLISAFDYGDKQLAVIYLLGGGGSILGTAIVYPVLSHLLGERIVLWVGLLAAAGHYLIYGLGRTSWMPYIAAGIEIFHSVTKPALGTMVSRGVDREQQGKVQGFMGAVRSGAAILAPLTIIPLAAASLGENPPFGLMGFPFIVCGSTMVLACLISTGLPTLPPPAPSAESTEYSHAPILPGETTPLVPSLN